MSLPCINPGCRGDRQREERNRFGDVALSCTSCGARSPWVRDYDPELAERASGRPWEEAKLLLATERWAASACASNPTPDATT